MLWLSSIINLVSQPSAEGAIMLSSVWVPKLAISGGEEEAACSDASVSSLDYGIL